MCWAPPPSLRAPHRLRQAAGALVPLQLSLLVGQPAKVKGASVSSDTVFMAVGVVVAVAAASIPFTLSNFEKTTDKRIAATDKRIDALEESTKMQIAATDKRIDALEKSTEKQIAALEKSTEKQSVALEKRIVVIEESTKSINTKLENIEQSLEKLAKRRFF